MLAGGIRSTSGARRFDAVPTATAKSVLRAGRRRASASPSSCTAAPARPPVALLHGAGRRGALARPDPAAVGEPDSCDDELGAALEDGLTLFAGLVPAVAAAGRALSDAGGYRRAGTTPVAPARAAPRGALRRVVVTPTCGMAGADPAHVLAALRLARAAAGQLADDPEA